MFNMISLDEKQKEVMEILYSVANQLEKRGVVWKIKGLFFKRTQQRGIYLYGGVGRGKTMLMKKFFEYITVRAQIIHFQKFIKDIHSRIHTLKDKNTNKVLHHLAKEISATGNVLCLDEFEIKDITDAMIVMRLVGFLIKEHVFVFITTNTPPEDLYKDGIQRESFLPFIDLIKRDFLTLTLDSEIDYRFNKIASTEERIFYPISDQSKVKINKIKKSLCDFDELHKVEVNLFGRDLEFLKGHKNILFTNFNELFERNLSYADFVAITEKFKIIVVEDIRNIASDETDVVIRFINFIDNAYFNKVFLIMELMSRPEDIYPNGKRVNEFARAISRIKEMNSTEYLSDKNEI